MTLTLPDMELLQQLYDEALRWYNLPFTILLGIVLCYLALKVFLTLCGAAFDFDFDGDLNGEPDGLFSRASSALTDGEAPFWVGVSFFAFLAWTSMMVLNTIFNPASVWAIGIAIMAACAALALFITRAILRFVGRLIKRVAGMTPQDESFIDEIGVVVTGEVSEKFGQVEIRHNGVPITFNAQLLPGSTPLTKGDYARIVKKGSEGKTYMVEKTAEAPKGAAQPS
ncbi:MAG: hypothetical protein ACQKBV_00320 [Puniceicoccales bacterium]